MKILKSKLLRKIGFLGFCFILIGAALFSQINRPQTQNPSGQVAGTNANSPLFINNKFCDDPKSADQKGCISFIKSVLAANHNSAYQDVNGPVRVSGAISWNNGASLLNTDQGGSIELGNGTGNPFIDFHRGLPNTDYNVRIANDADNQLSISGNVKAGGFVKSKITGTLPGDFFVRAAYSAVPYLEVYINNAAYGISMWASSEILKKDITDIEIDTNKIYNLRPVSYNWKDPGRGTDRQFGLIAEEVAKTIPELAMYGEKSEVTNVNYPFLSVLLLKEMQKQKSEIEELRQQIRELQAR